MAQLKYLDLTLPTPAENLACDEALLDQCEEHDEPEVLRFWEPQEYFVVLGYANKAATETNLDACRARNIAVLRRCSGGGTVLQGPGCLNYSLVLRVGESGPLHGITEANCFIMQRQSEALRRTFDTAVEVRGSTDLAVGQFKFSGNAQRRRRRCLLFHGTFLLQFDLALMEQLLPLPSKRPDYRGERSHEEFLTNLNFSPSAIKGALRTAWRAEDSLTNVPHEAIASLVKEKYSRPEWNMKF